MRPFLGQSSGHSAQIRHTMDKCSYEERDHINNNKQRPRVTTKSENAKLVERKPVIQIQ